MKKIGQHGNEEPTPQPVPEESHITDVVFEEPAEYAEGKEAEAEEPQAEQENRPRSIHQFKEGETVICISDRSIWVPHGGFGGHGHFEANMVLRQPHIFRGIYNGVIYLEDAKNKKGDGTPIIREYPVEEERGNWQYYEEPPFLKQEQEPTIQQVLEHPLTPDEAFEATKEGYAAQIRQSAAALAVLARLAEKKGLEVKINIETPAPHTAENAIYSVSIREVIKY